MYEERKLDYSDGEVRRMRLREMGLYEIAELIRDYREEQAFKLSQGII